MHLREALNQAEAQFRAGPHPDRARRDAETLLLHLTGKNRAWLLSHFDDDFGGCTAMSYASLIVRRLTGEPIQYITGECEFYGLPFRVTPDVLIPRPETEHLVEKALSLASQLPANHISSARVLDVGTGSGAIAIAIAHALKSKSVTAIDISEEALQVARTNAAQNHVDVRFLRGDLLQPVAGQTFDLIVSNPPYVSAADRDTLSVEVRDFEPSTALFAGPDGLEIYRRLIPAAFAALAVGGFLLLEIGYGQSDDLRTLLTNAGFTAIEFTPDLQGIPRVASAQRP